MKSDVTKGEHVECKVVQQKGIVENDLKHPISSEPDWQNVTRVLLTSRKIDRLEEEDLAPAGKIKLQLSSAGHELAQVLLGLALDHPCDAATVYSLATNRIYQIRRS